MTAVARHTQSDQRSNAVSAPVRSPHAVPRSSTMSAPARRIHRHVRSGHHDRAVSGSASTTTPNRFRAGIVMPALRACRSAAAVPRKSRSGSTSLSWLPAQLQARLASLRALARPGQIPGGQGLSGGSGDGGISIETNTSRWGCRRAA